MKSFFKGPAFKGLVVVALFLLGMMIYAATSKGVASIPETLTGAIVTPLQTLGARISDGFYDFIGIFTDSGRLSRDNEALESEIAELRKNQVELDELRFENESLRKFLNLKERNPDFELAHARVVSVDWKDQYGNFEINVGTLDGVKVSDPVISEGEYLVGIVVKTGPNFSYVQSILHPNTRPTAYVSRVDAKGNTGGSTSPAANNQIRLNNLTIEGGREIQRGYEVATTGEGGLYPAGLLIGQVESVHNDSNGVNMFAIVTPYADVKNLSTVVVITSFDRQGDAGDTGD